MTVPLVQDAGWRPGPPATGTCTVDTQGRGVDSGRACPWPLAEGGVRIHVAAWTAGDIDVVDMVIERCDPATDERPSAPFLREEVVDGEYRAWHETVSLPICRMRVDSRRLNVPVGQEATLHLGADKGPTLRVAVPRDE